MSYWHHDNNDRAERTQGKRMLSQYTAGRTAMLQGPKPTFFHNASDVELFYPNLSNTASGPPVRRTKAGGANVLRSAAINDTLSQLSAQNREHAQTQQLAAWHSQHEVKNKQGERSRNDKQLTADLKVANAELKLLRRARLKQLLEAEHQQHKRELAAKGLAIIYDEP